jgi:AcrR family transcriptional regulator
MRKLGQVMRVEAMSLYKHVANKEEILDGLVDLVMAEVDVPSPDVPWREAVRRSAVSTHAALLRHPWAAAVFESRLHPGPARLRYLEAMIGVLRGAGFDIADVARAFMLVDSVVYGHAFQLSAMPFEPGARPDVAEAMIRDQFAGAYPNLVAMAELALGGPDALPTDVEFGLEIVLDGLERHLAAR